MIHSLKKVKKLVLKLNMNKPKIAFFNTHTGNLNYYYYITVLFFCTR